MNRFYFFWTICNKTVMTITIDIPRLLKKKRQRDNHKHRSFTLFGVLFAWYA